MYKAIDQERAEAIERLREWVKEGDTVYTVLKHVSSSGMSRVIDVKLVIVDPKTLKPTVLTLGFNVAKALNWKYDEEKNGVKVGGAGMDMGFHLVYTLASVLFGDGYKLRHEWL